MPRQGSNKVPGPSRRACLSTARPRTPSNAWSARARASNWVVLGTDSAGPSTFFLAELLAMLRLRRTRDEPVRGFKHFDRGAYRLHHRLGVDRRRHDARVHMSGILVLIELAEIKDELERVVPD